MRRYLLLAVALCWLPAAWAAGPESVDMISDNPAIEARLKALSHELRCLVCQNQTLSDSHADLAVDLRNEIRELMAKGMTDQQVIDYLVARYGDFVLFRPPVKATTIPLWFAPFILAVLGAALLILYLRRLPARVKDVPLSDAEHKRLNKLLDQAKEDT
ncbi:MAG: cytochrome c-type biogenesis protein [Pseudomonadota bacterium]